MATPPDLATTMELAAPVRDLAQPAPPPDLAMPTDCDMAVATTDSGQHNAGKDCTGCHDGGNAIKW